MGRRFPFLFSLLALVALSACEDQSDDGPVAISIIGKPREILEPLTWHRSTAGRIMLGATAQGLVSYDADGEVIPALAQRWIVADEGKSYIFRLHRAHWANGDRVDAREVARLLTARIKAAKALDPYGNLSAVTDVLAMTTDVIEIHLSTARPNFLLMLAQPQMAIARKSGGTGPYGKAAKDDAVLLTLRDEQDDGTSADTRLVRAERAAKAVARFADGQADLVLGGTIADLPIAQASRAGRQGLRLDPARGIFGLAFMRHNALTDNAQVRDAIAMSIDRASLVRQFDNGWTVMETLSPPLTNLPHAPTRPDWASLSLRDRQVEASKIMARWRQDTIDTPATLSLATGSGPGHRLLFSIIAHDLAQIGIVLSREENAEKADLVLIDEVAGYDSAFWYLGRLSCARKLHCDPQGDELLRQATTAQDMDARNRLLGEAEGVIAAYGGFIPIAAPLRWSLVRARMTGFRPSTLAMHPLDALD